MSLDHHIDVTNSGVPAADTTEFPGRVIRTGTGLDHILDVVSGDQGLNVRTREGDIVDGAEAAARMNAIILEAIKATGIANDGAITAADVTALSDYIQVHHLESWLHWHGDDENGEETGFHLIQNDGGSARLFGDQAINTVADGIYHLGFGYANGRLINEDGNANARLEDVAFWLEALLADDLESGALSNPKVDPYQVTRTGTGLDALLDAILDDPGLTRRISHEELLGGAKAAAEMNAIIIDAIKATGVANDGYFTAADITLLSDYVRAHHYEAFFEAHGNDEGNIETGFHLVQNDGAEGRLYGENTVNTVADGIYHLVFGYDNGNLINEDGNRNARLTDVAHWMNQLLAADLSSGALTNMRADPSFNGTTGTGLDDLIDIITEDPGLNRRIPAAEIEAGADAANTMNEIILEGIEALGLADDGQIRTSEVYALSDWIVANREAEWITAHGDDENNEETGFHLVQNDGAESDMFARDAVDTVADGLYHLGFGYRGDRLINEDGNNNARVEDVAFWLNSLLAGDLPDLATGNLVEPRNATGTGLDHLTAVILDDAELNRRIPLSEIHEGVEAANTMNAIILEGIEATGIAQNGRFTAGDVRLLSDWIVANREAVWIEAHGDDENNLETGFHLVQNDGATTRYLGNNAVNTVADGLYHLGFGYRGFNLINEDGNSNADLADVAYWLEELLSAELADGSLNGVENPYVSGSTGTGLDQLVDAIFEDGHLNRRFSTAEIATSAAAADTLANILIEAIRETGVANDGRFTEVDLRDIDHWIANNRLDDVDAALGTDSRDSDGFLRLRWEGATEQVEGENAIDGLSAALFSLGHGIRWSSIYDANGNWMGNTAEAAQWLNALLEADFEAGTLLNPDLDLTDPATFAQDIVAQVEGQITVADRAGYAEIAHSEALALENGTVAFRFTLNDPGSSDTQVLFTKDASGYGAGGHMAAYIYNGQLTVRLQSQSGSNYYSLDQNIAAGESYDFALSFGADGLSIYLNGVKLFTDASQTINWALNTEDLVFGASGWSRSESRPDHTWHYIDGSLEDVQIYDRALSRAEIGSLSEHAQNAGSLIDYNPFAFAAGAPMISAADQDPRLGTGLTAQVFDTDHSWGSIYQLVEEIDAGATATHLLNVNRIDFSGGETLTEFLAGNASITQGDGSAALETMAFRVAGYVWIDAGTHDLTVRSDDGFLLRLGGEDVLTHPAPRGTEPTSGQFELEGGLYEIELFYYENYGGQSLELQIDGEVVTMDRFFESVDAFEAAQDYVTPEPAALSTGTGLDTIIEWIRSDDGLLNRLSEQEIEDAALAAHEMNVIILEAIAATGAGDDGTLSVGEVYDLASWINANRYEDWLTHHGDDENGVETGFHLVQNDGDSGYAFGEAQIDTIADAIYHLGFGYRNNRLINEDGNNNERVEEVALWLSELLADDLANGRLASGNDRVLTGSTGTGLDALIDLIWNDPELARRLPEAEVIEGGQAADAMNEIIIEAILATGVGNDGTITAAEVAGLSDWIVANRHAAWITAHGDDENDSETGFHLVQNDGAISRLYGDNAVDTVADGLYHLGFGYRDGRLINEDGNNNARLESVAFWLTDLLEVELGNGSLANPDIEPVPLGTTGTGLDRLVEIIARDAGLNEDITLGEITSGAIAADGMNLIIIEGISANGYAVDGAITAAEVRGLSEWVQANFLEEWILLHGDDEAGVETGFHLVQNDGSEFRLYGENAINTIADGLYHLGFGYTGNNLINEDGNRNAELDDVAHWLELLLADELVDGSLNRPGTDPTPVGTTGTGLDRFVDTIAQDEGLARRVSITEIQAGAAAADAMNHIIITAIRETGIAANGRITASDVRTLSDHIAANYLAEWIEHHGNDENGLETGFHLVQNDGAEARLFGTAAVDAVLDGTYHLGFGYRGNRLINEDGDNNQTLQDVAHWLEAALSEELADGSLVVPGLSAYVEGDTGTGLDVLTDLITTDDNLLDDVTTEHVAEAAESANALNALIVDGIAALGIANDGRLSVEDVKDLIRYLVDTAPQWAALYGQDSGFDVADQSEGASLFGERGLEDVAEGIYSLGFGFDGSRVTEANGQSGERLEDIARWLNTLLEADIDAGALNGIAGEAVAAESFADALVSSVEGDIGAIAIFGHDPSFETPSTTVALDFTLSDLDTRKQALFSKDFGGNEAGSVTAWVQGDKLRVRFETGAGSVELNTGDYRLQAGESYSFALTFGEDGAHLWLNGQKLDSNDELLINWLSNDNEMVVGAATWWRSEGYEDRLDHLFRGDISNVGVYERALSRGEILGLNRSGDLPLVTLDGPELALAELSATGSGLSGAVYDTDDNLSSISDVEDLMETTEADVTFSTHAVSYEGPNWDATLSEFLEEEAYDIAGASDAVSETFAVSLTGYIALEGGRQEIAVRSDDGFRLTIGGQVVAEYSNLRSPATTLVEIEAEAGLYEIELLYFENTGQQVLELFVDGEVVTQDALYATLEDTNTNANGPVVVLGAIQGETDAAMTLRLDMARDQLRLQTADGRADLDAPLEVGLVSISGPQTYLINDVRHHDYATGIAVEPTEAVFADMQTMRGGDTSTVGVTHGADGEITTYIAEETVSDPELGHTRETVGLAVLSGGELIDTSAETVGIVAQISSYDVLDGGWLRVDFGAYGLSAGDLSGEVIVTLSNLGDSATQAVTELRSVSATGFEFRIHDWDDGLDHLNLTDELSFLAVEEGAHTLRDGTEIIAVNVTLNEAPNLPFDFGQLGDDFL